MHFANDNWVLFLAPAFVLLGLVLLYTLLVRDRRDMRTLGFHNLILSPGWAWARRTVRGLLFLLALFFGLLGALRWQGKPVPEDLNLSGVDMMVVLDTSKSMLTQDMAPDRLEAAKKSVLDWLADREGDRVGLVVFAGEAIVQVPLTLDLQAVSLVLDQADVNAVDRGGTDIGEGIRTALEAFPKEEDSQRGRAILLLTDGEPTEGSSNLSKACLEAKEKHVPIVVVGIGTRQGRPIPEGVSFWGESLYKKDQSGRVRISRLDEKNLAKIAELTGGAVVYGDSPEGLTGIGRSLESLKKTAMKGKGAVRREELAPSMGLWTAGALMLGMLL